MNIDNKNNIYLAKLIQYELSKIFIDYRLNVINKGITTINRVILTNNLEAAKIYISFYNLNNQDNIINKIISYKDTIRYNLAKRIRYKIRIIPKLLFYKDNIFIKN